MKAKEYISRFNVDARDVSDKLVDLLADLVDEVVDLIKTRKISERNPRAIISAVDEVERKYKAVLSGLSLPDFDEFKLSGLFQTAMETAIPPYADLRIALKGR